MLNHLILSIPLVIITIAILIYKIRKSKQGKNNYIQRGDAIAQKDYAQARSVVHKLSLKQLTEMSWQFLYDITKTILKRFSREDQEEVMKIGSKLHEMGVKYEHQITNNIIYQSHQNIAVEKTTNRGKSH
ncbi:DUF2660 domain-containing protein [Orientia tsutsugamushi]|uniref:DUF2660 domain-containing protein n=1 Tax=Orientia tsutsugamushi str. TA716 TaxID=1359175 RepID=A0A0F3PBC2_ORITS|nr:DUF2660 domain-containing protein [Orientia tsutsugamushi]KJV77620.1 hypothetical protein OTSTA716_0123 [Orientia tsutsugamushi str. TA716]